jgi:hypothetical protein
MQTRLWWGLADSALGRNLELGGRFYVGTFAFSLREYISTLDFLYRFCASNVNRKDNAAINWFISIKASRCNAVLCSVTKVVYRS